MNINELIEHWNSPEGHPYKGKLIDWRAYESDPNNIGCMCAQGQVLTAIGGWEPERLRYADQIEADREVAKLLGISTAHAILLRGVNDSIDGAPAIVLTDPEKVLGDQAQTVLAFWRHLERMTGEQWKAAWAAASEAAGKAAWAAALSAAWVAAREAAGKAAREAAGDAALSAAWVAAKEAAWYAALAAASCATAEIMGAKIMRERGQPFFFLPLFGFADPEAVLAADQAVMEAE